MLQTLATKPDTPGLDDLLSHPPVVEGHSKRLFEIDDERFMVQLIPSLASFTHQRYEMVAETEVLRLDFYEMAAALLERVGIRTAFERRVSSDCYVARRCASPPFETIVKNVATGSTLRKYPGLFPEGFRFAKPVVKFDYRIDPEDQPISDDYVAAAGFCPQRLKDIALEVNARLREWLAPADLLDFCLIIGLDETGRYVIISEISPDCMRLRSATGAPLDKDLFRFGADHATIRQVWGGLVSDLRRGAVP